MEWQGIQLAKDFDPAKAEWPMFAEPKLDGYRLVARISKDGVVTFHCRDAEPVKWPRQNLLHIERALIATGFRDCYVDGEIMHETWGETACVKSSKTKQEDIDKLRFHIFDYVRAGHEHMTQEARRLALKQFNLWSPPPGCPLIRVASTVVHNHAEAIAIDKVHREAGYEGTMLKEISAPYSFKRSKAWVKLKPFKTIEGKVTGLEEGKGKHKGRLGALVCVDKAGRTFRVGTGFSDELREEIWDTRAAASQSYEGSIVEVSVQDSDVSTVRHPSFLRFRPDRTSL